jgi:hypothetical protein
MKLFAENKNGSLSHFVEMLRKQILEEQVAHAIVIDKSPVHFFLHVQDETKSEHW